MGHEAFEAAILAIKEQLKFDRDKSDRLGNAFPNAFKANFLPEQSPAIDGLIFLLRQIYGDEHGLIEYYIFEVNFGKKSAVISINGKEYPFVTPKDVYNCLIVINDNNH